MKKLLAIAILSLTAQSPSFAEPHAITPPPDHDIATLKRQARATAKEFGTALKADLQGAMSTGGVIAAIEVCNLRAPEIAAEISKRYRFKIGRTSHKVRNPANAPDEWESARLQEFLVAVEQGSKQQDLESAAIVETDRARVFRYMKAIPTDAVCLACHGQELEPEVVAALDKLYPTDQARGFMADDLRGAFTLIRDMN